MAKGILKVAALFVLFIIIFELQRIAFICCNLSIVGEHDFADYFCALLAGLPLDASMAGYFSLGLLVLSVIRVWSDTKALRIIERSYLLLISVVVAIISVLDITLYGYWGFRLDATPLFYFTSSPVKSSVPLTDLRVNSSVPLKILRKIPTLPVSGRSFFAIAPSSCSAVSGRGNEKRRPLGPPL